MLLTAAVLDVVALLLAFGVRTIVQLLRTGDSGWRLGRPHSAAEAFARASLVVGGVSLGVAVGTGSGSDGLLAVTGVGGAVVSIALIGIAQLQMGTSWRIGVDHDEQTDLVSTGIFARIRNPIYTGMAGFAVAHVAMTPTPWAVFGAAAMIVGVQMQTRLVEEPYLRSVHGDDFVTWGRRAGRFVPGLGRFVTDA